jgi:3-methylfumaryl-CoA hydratase
MFAGGRVRMREPLRFMTQATRTTRLCRSVRRQGRQGMLTFATVNHQWSQDGGLVITEEQDIVYLPGSAEPARATAAPARTAVAVHSDGGTDAPANPSVDGRTGRPADARTELTPNAPGSDAAGPRLRFSIDPTVLFRFSALTYNAHRIHYDTGYAAEQGYPDLVIHGPLQALLMAELLRRSGHDLFGRTFSYRLVAPAFGAQTLTVTADGSPGRAWVRDEMGRTTASATLTDLGSTAESTEATESAVAE